MRVRVEEAICNQLGQLPLSGSLDWPEHRTDARVTGHAPSRRIWRRRRYINLPRWTSDVIAYHLAGATGHGDLPPPKRALSCGPAQTAFTNFPLWAIAADEPDVAAQID